MRLNINPTLLPNVFSVLSQSSEDVRGTFTRLFCAEELANILNKRSIVQINQSTTYQVGAIRGLHFQLPPYAEMKFVRCLKGKIWDVAVNLQTGKWHAEILSDANQRMLIIPEGCAHGFQVLEPNSQLLYLHTACYDPSSERGIHPLDRSLDIRWPLPVAYLSDRDRQLPSYTKGMLDALSPL